MEEKKIKKIERVVLAVILVGFAGAFFWKKQYLEALICIGLLPLI